MQAHLLAGEIGLVYSDRFREFGILYRDGGSSKQTIYYCPWCGTNVLGVGQNYQKVLPMNGLKPSGIGI